MTTLATSEQNETILAFLEQQYSLADPSDPLQKLKAAAWERFQELGLPSRKIEAFCYLKLRNFYAKEFTVASQSDVTLDSIDAHIIPECKQSVLVFVNGFFNPSLSNISGLPKRIVITSLQDAMRTYGTFINNQWTKTLKEETDALAAANAALHQSGLFIYLPPKSVVETPIQILNVIDTQDEAMLIMPRVHVFAGTHSEVDILNSFAVLSGNCYGINQAVDFTVEDCAHVRYNQLGSHTAPNIWHFDAVRAILKRDCNFLTTHATEGSATVRSDYRVIMAGENSQASLNGVWTLNDTREAHTHVLIEHQAPHCKSFQLFKGVLNDASKSSFEGKILVQRPAQKTDAFQLNRNLIISDRAHADSKPNLEIFADDVKASHGATVGQLDNEQLFYMKTRGFSEAEAQNMLIYSFTQEVIDLFSIPSVKQQLTSRAKNRK